MASFCAVLFSLGVLDEIWELIESVSEGFPTYSYKAICVLVLEKKVFKVFYHIWAWQPLWSCDPFHLYKF